MTSEHFSLCWNNFHSNLSSGFHSLYESEDFVDVTLAAEGRYLKAHKMVLSVCSQYFKELFQVNPCKHPIVILKDVSYGALRDLLQFMYLGEVNVSQEELSNLMKVAELLQIKGLTEQNVDSSHLTHNGLRSIHVSDTAPSNPRPESRSLLKRTKSSKKSQSLSPAAKIPKSSEDQHLKSDEVDSLVDSASTTTFTSPNRQSESEFFETVKPKTELVVDESTGYTLPEMDVASMLDTNLGETSTQSSMSWKSELSSVFKVSDNDSPGGRELRLLTTPKGRTVVIHNGHMYTLGHQQGTRTQWLCVMQRKLSCAGCVTTAGAGTAASATGPILLSYSGHNHSQLNDVIQRLNFLPK